MGWHWVMFDDSNRSLEEKIAVAAIKFRKKFGVYPTECLVLPRAINDLKTVGNVQVKPKHNALQGHLWLGMNDDGRKTGIPMAPFLLSDGPKTLLDLKKVLFMMISFFIYVTLFSQLAKASS